MSAMQDVATGVHRLVNLVSRDRAERARAAREAEERLHVGNQSDLELVGAKALPVGLAHIFRRHLVRLPEHKYRRSSSTGRVRLACSCFAVLTLEAGAHICATDGCDRVWFVTSRGVHHAHPDQTAPGLEAAA